MDKRTQPRTYQHTGECSLVNGGNECDCGAWKKDELLDSGKGQEDVSVVNTEQGVNNVTLEKKPILDKVSPPEKSKGIGKFLED